MRFGVYLPTFAGPGLGLDEAARVNEFAEGRTLMRMLASLALVAALFVDATPGAAAPEGR